MSFYSKRFNEVCLGIDCSQSSIFRKIIEIERFVLRAAILWSVKTTWRGRWFGREREKSIFLAFPPPPPPEL